MPLYEFECDRCGQVMERIFSIALKPPACLCSCGGVATGIISGGANRREWEPYWDENLGDTPVLIESRAQRKRLMKEAGVIDSYKTPQYYKEKRQKLEHIGRMRQERERREKRE